MNLHGVEFELNRMRAETLGEYGKKLELLNEMIKSRKCCVERRAKILERLDTMVPKITSRRKKRMYAALCERLAEKQAKDTSHIERLHEKRKQVYSHVIAQREALGITEHSWIDKYYMDDEHQ